MNMQPMRMTGFEKRFVNGGAHSRAVAEAAVRRLHQVPVCRGWSCLEVGCGNGAAALLVAHTYGVRVVGVDIDAEQIAVARDRAGDRSDVLFTTADATCLPFEDARFDLVASNKTTHHVSRWSAAIAEMRRVLKPNGYLVYADLTAPPWLAWGLKPLAGHTGVFTGADLDRCFASLRSVQRRTGWLYYEVVLQKP
jgi:ubiquinone/menaquinone biosynthesis C-methylase UbiE